MNDRRSEVAVAHRFASQIAFVRARLSRQHRLGLRLTLSVLAFVAATWLFLGIAEDVVTGDPLVNMDRRIAQWFHAHATPGLTRWMLVVTHAHGTTAIGAMGTVLGTYLWWRKDWSWLLTLIAVLPGGMLLNLLLKQLFRRDRPSFDDPLLSSSSYGFPSGHVTGAALFYGVLAAFLASKLPTWRARSCVVGHGGFSRDSGRRDARLSGRALFQRRGRRGGVEHGLGRHVACRRRHAEFEMSPAPQPDPAYRPGFSTETP